MPQYARDPRWMTARFPSTCTCSAPIKKGDRIYYFPNGKQALCAKCGEPAAAAFQAAASDEAFASGQSW